MSRLGVLLLVWMLTACTAAGRDAPRSSPEATVAFRPTSLPSGVPTSAGAGATLVEGTATLAVPADTPAVLATQAPVCETHQAGLVLTPSAASLQVGETLILTATLRNSGCAMTGLPQYSLSLEESDPQVLQPDQIEPVLHYLGLNEGQQDAAQFRLHAAAPGSVQVQALVSFEVHLGYPGPAYWGTAASQPVMVEVTP